MTGYSLKEISTRLNTGQIPQVAAGKPVYTQEELVGAIGNINSPLLDMPLKNSLAMKAGVGSATFTRASTATYIDRYGVLKTAAIDEPRFEKEGYLNEGSSTNLLTYSEQFDNATWVKSNLTVIANTTDTLDPYGTNFADKISKSASYGRVQQTPTVSAVPHTLSVFVKAGTADNCTIRMMTGVAAEVYTIRFTFSTKTASYIAGTGTNKIEELANGWFRVSLTATFIDTTSLCIIYPDIYNTESTGSIYIFGAQLEALPFASSYIPTVGASVTRSADKLVVTGIGNFPGSQNFTALIDFDSFGFDTATYSPYSRLFEVAVTGGVVGIRASSSGLFYSAHGSTFVYGGFVSNLSGQPITSKKRFATIANNGLISNAENGVLVTSPSYSNGYAPTGGINIGSDTGTGGMLYGHISNVRIYDRVLTTQEVALA